MARIYLHIGTHKTGTTSIQYYLNYRKEELLAQGILAPAAGKTPDSDFSGNHRLAWGIMQQKGETSTESWKELKSEMEGIRHDAVVLSSEAFCHFSNDHVIKVKQLLKDHEVFIIVYFRNYKDYFRSVYAQVVWDKVETRSFSDYILSRPDLVDFDNILRNWGEHFGYDHLIIKIYDEIVSKNELLQDFCQTVGFIAPDNDPRFKINRNITPEERDINAMRLINLCRLKFPFILKDRTFRNLKEAIFIREDKYTWQKRIFRFLAKNRCYTKKSDLLISELFKNSNRELLREMIGEERMKILAR